MIGRNLSHYRILETLGKGGMGEVYVAEDPKLKRRVALKVLPPEMAADPDRCLRFEREAQALAALNHPNIVTVHSVEEADGIHFITMELVEGNPLSGQIREGGIPIDGLFDIAIPLADALAAAHERGITHRDLKPDNVMVTREGRVKVLDFGLAKLAEGTHATGGQATQLPTAMATQEGKILGTVAYMSPEQAEGKPVDARSDVFSLGILLYEMATGRRPFQGDTTISTITSIMRDTPRPITELSPRLPRHLGRIVTRCLTKDPERRYQTAKEVRNELEHLKAEFVSAKIPQAMPQSPVIRHGWARKGRLVAAGAILLGLILLTAYLWMWSGEMERTQTQKAPGPSAPPASLEKSIAVLPFVNMSADPANEYFSDGLSEELLNSLAQLRGLKVAARTSSFAFKGQNVDLRTIAERLGVSTVLEGSVRRQGERVRITAQLINASDGYHLWSESYERELDDVFGIQADIAQRVAGALRVTLLQSDTERLETPDTRSTAAYDAYLHGLNRMASFQVDSVLEAAASFRTATELDPAFAKAHAGIANAYLLAYETTAIHHDDLFRLAEPAMNQAIALDPGLSEAHAARGGILGARGEIEAAKAAFRRALELNPGNTLASHLYAVFLWSRWELEEMLDVFDQAIRVDPFDSTLHGLRGWGLQSAGRLDDALSATARSRAIDEDNPIGYYSAGLLYLDALGDPVEAEIWLQRSAEVDPEDPELVAWLAHIYLTLDDLPRAERMAQRALEMNSRNAFVLSTRALVHLRQGDEGAALNLARRGLEPDVSQRFAGRLVFLRIVRTNWLREGRIAEAVRAYEAAYPTLAQAADFLSAPLHMPQLETGELVRAAVDLANLRMVSDDEQGARALIRLVREALDREPRMQYLRLYGPGTALAEIAILEGRNEEALVALEQVVDTGWLVNWRWEIQSNPIFDAVRDEPAYHRIIGKLEASTRRQRERWEKKNSGT